MGSSTVDPAVASSEMLAAMHMKRSLRTSSSIGSDLEHLAKALRKGRKEVRVPVRTLRKEVRGHPRDLLPSYGAASLPGKVNATIWKRMGHVADLI